MIFETNVRHQADHRRGEWEILRAVDLSIDDIGRARRAFSRADAMALRKRAESVLGFGASPSRPFCESSWS